MPYYDNICSILSLNYFSNALRCFLYVELNIICLRFDIMKKRLISSYDEVSDTFVGKVDGQKGFCADFDISGGIFLGIDKNNFPNSIYVKNASEVLNIPKQILENSNVKIKINCDRICLHFNMSIEDLSICSVKCKNKFQIPYMNFEMDSNY